jgi:hypothetical protein
MNKKQLEESLADTGYIMGYLDSIKVIGNDHDRLAIKRARELNEQVAKRLQAALFKLQKPAKPSPKALGASRRAAVLALAKQCDLFVDAKLDDEKLNKLYDIVVAEAENWDGEEVDVEYVADLMASRYMQVGLAPSRN